MFRFCVNKPNREIVAKEMMVNLMNLLWYKEKEGIKRFTGYGVNFYPREIRNLEYNKDYKELIDRLNYYVQ